MTGTVHKTKGFCGIAYILVLLAGLIYLLIGSFHGAVWFDEAYTVGLVRHDIFKMINISVSDVHPPLYYIILKLYSYVAGNSVTALRIASVLCTWLMALLGYTHIRKDFGSKCGLLFSILVFLMPCDYVYSQQIRMYSMAALFVTLTAIYGYRIVKYNSMHNRILFVIFSLCSAYSHWYGLAATGLINLIMLFYMHKDKNKALKTWIVMAVSQIMLYIPGFIIMYKQAGFTSDFWVRVKYPDIIFDILSFNLSGNPGKPESVYAIAGALLFAAAAFLLVRFLKRDRKKAMPAVWALSIYFGIAVLFLIVSVSTPLFYTRYLYVCNGLLIFALSSVFSSLEPCEDSKGFKTHIAVTALLLVLLAVYSGAVAFNVTGDAYDASNIAYHEQADKYMQSDDIILVNNTDALIFMLDYDEHKSYFYNKYHWSVKEAYEAFGDNFKVIDYLDLLKGFKGRMWIIGDLDLYEQVNEYCGVNIITQFDVSLSYYRQNFLFMLVEADFTE